MPKKHTGYIVANPRRIPAGKHVIRVGDRRWYEGDPYDGPLVERFVRDGFLVQQGKVSDGEK